MATDTLTICLEQKLFHITKIKSLTVQMLEHCTNDEMSAISSLFAQRQQSIDKIEKCRVLIEKMILECDPDNIAALQRITSNSMLAEECPKQWQQIFNSNEAFQNTLKDVCALDEQLQQCLLRKREVLLQTKPKMDNRQKSYK